MLHHQTKSRFVTKFKMFKSGSVVPVAKIYQLNRCQLKKNT